MNNYRTAIMASNPKCEGCIYFVSNTINDNGPRFCNICSRHYEDYYASTAVTITVNNNTITINDNTTDKI